MLCDFLGEELAISRNTVSTTYWIYKNGHQSGPFTFPQIQSMREARTINVTDQMRGTDSQQWHAIGKISRRIGWGHNRFCSNILATTVLALIVSGVLSGWGLLLWLVS